MARYTLDDKTRQSLALLRRLQLHRNHMQALETKARVDQPRDRYEPKVAVEADQS